MSNYNSPALPKKVLWGTSSGDGYVRPAISEREARSRAERNRNLIVVHRYMSDWLTDEELRPVCWEDLEKRVAALEEIMRSKYNYPATDKSATPSDTFSRYTGPWYPTIYTNTNLTDLK